MIKRKLRKYQLGQNGIPVKQTGMWDTNVPNFNNPYVTAPLAEDDWHHNVDNISFPGEGMTPLNSKNSKYFSQEELLNPSEEETSGNTQSTGGSKNKIKNKFNFNFNPGAYAKLQGVNGLLEGIGNIYQQNQQNQSRIDMNPLSGLDFANGRSEQSKYGYSFQKGGVKPKVYTDRKQFEQAQRMYNDSLNVYNVGEKDINNLVNKINPLLALGNEKAAEDAYQSASDDFLASYDRLGNPKPIKRIRSLYNKYEAVGYKKPVQPVAYQPNGTVSSPQTVSSQQGKSGIWGNEYNKKHPPIYVTNPKDPRIGQYGKDGNQYLYKGPTHPIQKMSRINPQQMDLNSNVNIQGQQVPFSQFQLPQQKGTPIYGPGNTIIGYSDNMNFKPAYQYTGAPNNTLNLQDKALLENPEALRKYVLSRDNYKFPIQEFKDGGGKMNPPKVYTDKKQFEQAQKMYNDSLDLYNNGYIKQDSILKSQGYKVINKYPTPPQYEDVITEISPNVFKTKREKLWNTNFKPLYELEYNTPTINQGKHILDNVKYDNGLVGQTRVSFYKKPVQPVVFRSHPIQKMDRLSFSTQGSSQVNIQGVPLNVQPMVLPQQNGTPVYGPGNTIVGYSDNMNFKPAYQYTGAPNNQLNLQDKVLLDNPEELKKYLRKKDNYKFSNQEFQKGGYTVKKGDNLTKIAKQYNVPLNELLRLNYIQNRNLIYPGQEINLPKTKQIVKTVTPVNTKDYSINRPVNIPKSNKATMSASLGLPNNKQNIVSGSISLGSPKSNIQVPLKTVKTPIKIESKPVQNKGFTNSLVYKKPDFKNPVWIGEVQPKTSTPNNSKNVIKGTAELNPYPEIAYPGKINEVKKIPRNIYEKKIFKSDFVYDKNKFMSDPNIPQLVKDLYEKELNINPNKKANIVDKATNTQYITLNNGNIKPLQVITGKNSKGNYEYKSLDEIEKSSNPFKYKVTPEGKFSYEGSINDTDRKDYNNNIYAFNKFNVAQHQLYNPEVRSKWLNTGNPKDRYGSYGCVNCRKEDFENYIKSNFSKKDSILILNSDKTLEEFEKQYKKNSFQKGGSFLDQEEDFLYEEENDYTENDAQKTERVTDEQIKQEIRKRNKYSLDNDYLGLFEKSRRKLRSSQDFEITENYEPAKTNTSENQSFAFNYLQQKGLQPHQAAGVVGNFTQESNMNPGITNSIGAFGAGQWLGSRKKALFQYAKTTGKDPYHLQTQLDFTLHELSTTEKKAGNALGNTKTSAEAARVFRKMYERPGEAEANDKRRIQEAKKLYPYQEGGDFIKDPTMEALSNVYTQRNKNLPWVDRGLKPQNYPVYNQQDFMKGNEVISHRLSWDDNLIPKQANPQNPEFYVRPEVGYNNGMLEWDNKQEPIIFNNKQMAKYFSQNGLIKHKKKGGSLSNWEIIEY